MRIIRPKGMAIGGPFQRQRVGAVVGALASTGDPSVGLMVGVAGGAHRDMG